MIDSISRHQLPLIVITGPTASGKSGLAMELAMKYGGEIVCADSRTVYRGMDIGTAKPSSKDRYQVPHHLLDVVKPDEVFTAARFKQLANEATADIRARGKVPFLVGGTGLYIDSVVLDYSFVEQNDQDIAERERLEKLSTEELLALLQKLRIEYHSDLNNRRHMIGALIRKNHATSRSKQLDAQTYVVAIATDKQQLEQRIRQRAGEMFESGIISEFQRLTENYGWECESMTGNIYPIIHQLIEGGITHEEAIELFIIRDRQLAKRQITWLKRHDFVEWRSLDEAKVYLSTILDRN